MGRRDVGADDGAGAVGGVAFVARLCERGGQGGAVLGGLEGKDDGDCALDVVAKRARRVVVGMG